jgi:hypothetical protein
MANGEWRMGWRMAEGLNMTPLRVSAFCLLP